MRLWTLHPRYLDTRGLVAVWREALLAQAVLRGKTSGYTRHPQLERFRSSDACVGAIAGYLREIQEEGTRRGYHFDASKIAPETPLSLIPVTSGQVHYEWRWLQSKLEQRSPGWMTRFKKAGIPQVHPLFRIVAGEIEDWERPPGHRRRK